MVDLEFVWRGKRLETNCAYYKSVLDVPVATQIHGVINVSSFKCSDTIIVIQMYFWCAASLRLCVLRDRTYVDQSRVATTRIRFQVVDL